MFIALFNVIIPTLICLGTDLSLPAGKEGREASNDGIWFIMQSLVCHLADRPLYETGKGKVL